MRVKLILTAAIFFALLGFATVQMRAEIPIVQADTVFQGFGGGSVSGIVFGPTGETVILMHDAQPVEINIKTKQIVREFEQVPNAKGDEPLLFIDKIKNYIGGVFLSTEYLNGKPFNGEIIWDLTTGKIIKAIPNVALLTDGKNYYSYFFNDKKLYIGLFNINSLKFIDSVEFDQGLYHGQQTKFTAGFGIIPNSNKVIIGTYSRYENETGLSTLSVLDFGTKLYTEIMIPYQEGTKSSNISNIKVSETGKYLSVDMSTNLNDDTLNGTMFFNNEYKYLFTETGRNIKAKIGDGSKNYYFSHPYFLNDDYIIAVIAEKYLSEPNISSLYNGLYEINGKSLLKRINFDEWRNLCYNNKDIAVSNYSGTVILLNKFALSVNDDKIITTQDEAEFINGILTINSPTAEKADINIIDYQGNLIYTKKEIYLQAGKNLLNIDFPLTNGVYFAVVKTIQKELSYKFLVNR